MGNIYHEWNGTVLTVTSDSGTSSADLKGDMGVRGPQGVAGKTGNVNYKVLEDYPTKEEVTVQIAEAQLPEKDVDLSGYYARSEANSIFANTLKGSKSGEAVVANDISPIEQELKVNIRSKNLMAQAPTRKLKANFNECYFLPKGKYTASMNFANATSWRYTITLYDLNGNLITDTTSNTTHLKGISKVLNYSSGNGGIYQNADNVVDNYLTIETDNDYYIGINFHFGDTTDNTTVTNPQLEVGTIATEYTPYIADLSGVEVGRYGANIFDIGTKDTYETVVTTISISNESITGLIGDASASKVFKKKNYKSGKYAISMRGDNARILVQCFDVNGNVMTNSQVTIGGGTYNSYYQGWYWQPNSVAIIDVPDSVSYWRMGINFIGEVGKSYIADNIQIAFGDTVTEYEPYQEPQTAIANANGTVEGLTAIYPTTTITTDTTGIVVDMEYNRDINKAFAELQQAIISLGGNV